MVNLKELFGAFLRALRRAQARVLGGTCTSVLLYNFTHGDWGGHYTQHHISVPISLVCVAIQDAPRRIWSDVLPVLVKTILTRHVTKM